MKHYEQLEQVLHYFKWDFLTLSRLSKVSKLWHLIIKTFYQHLRKQQRRYINIEYKYKYSWLQSHLFPDGVLCRDSENNSGAVAHARRRPEILTGQIDHHNFYNMIFRLDSIHQWDNYICPLPRNYYWSSQNNINNEQDAIQQSDIRFHSLVDNWLQIYDTNTYILNDITQTFLGCYWSTPSSEKVFFAAGVKVPDNYVFLERIIKTL